MWKRFKRWVRSVFGGAVDSLEDPEKILMQNIRDMNDQIPIMNENIAVVKANVQLSDNNLKKIQEKEQSLRDKIKAALLAGNREMARTFATNLETLQAEKATAEGNRELAERSYEKALKVKEAFTAERERKIKEALRAINMAKQAEWQNKVAKTMETFEIADIAGTHDEMIQKIEEKVAKAQARMEVALTSTGADEYEMEKEAQKMRADELLRQFELELGMKPAEATPTEKTLGQAEKAPAEKENGVKTIGQTKVTG